MLEHSRDVATDIGGRDADECGPHQHRREVAGPERRIPDIDPTRGAVLSEPNDDENEADYGNERIESLIGRKADALDQPCALIPQGRDDVHAEKHDEPEYEYRKAHGFAPIGLE